MALQALWVKELELKQWKQMAAAVQSLLRESSEALQASGTSREWHDAGCEHCPVSEGCMTNSIVGCCTLLTWVVSQCSKCPQHILNALRGELTQFVHQLALQDLEQHGAWVVVQGGKGPQGVGDVLAVEVLQPLHGL